MKLLMFAALCALTALMVTLDAWFGEPPLFYGAPALIAAGAAALIGVCGWAFDALAQPRAPKPVPEDGDEPQS